MSDIHPEMNEGPMGDMMREVAASDTCEVWCKGCQAFRTMNARYAKYLAGEIESCSKCRK